MLLEVLITIGAATGVDHLLSVAIDRQMSMVAILHDLRHGHCRLDDPVGIAGGFPVDLRLLLLLLLLFLIRDHGVRFVGVGCVEAFSKEDGIYEVLQHAERKELINSLPQHNC